MATVKARQSAFMKRCMEGSMAILSFPCPACSCENQTLQANKGETWDSLSFCPECDAMFLKIVSDTAVVTLIPGGTHGQNHHHVN